MDKHRKKAKEYFINCTRTEYDALIAEAYFTNRQIKIAMLKKEDNNIPTWEIANILDVSPETVTRELKRIYEKVSKIRML